MDKYGLKDKIKNLEGLTDEEKSALLGLLRSHKKNDLVWEDKLDEVDIADWFSKSFVWFMISKDEGIYTGCIRPYSILMYYDNENNHLNSEDL